MLNIWRCVQVDPSQQRCRIACSSCTCVLVDLHLRHRRQLSPVLADVLAREVTKAVVLQEVLLCAPLLDVVYFTRLFTSLNDDIGEHVSSVGLTLLFASCDRQEDLEQITSAFVDSCRICLVNQPDAHERRFQVILPRDWTRYAHPSAASPESHSTEIQQVQEFQERVLSLSSSPNGCVAVD